MPGTWTTTSSGTTTYSYKTGQEIPCIFSVGEYVYRPREQKVLTISRIFWYDGEWCADAFDSDSIGGKYRVCSFEKIDFSVGL